MPRCGGPVPPPPPPVIPLCWQQEGGGDTFVTPPRQGLVGQKVLRCKTIAEREIQLVKGLVAISQALKKREGEERGEGGGDVFMASFIYLFRFSPEVGPPSLASPSRSSLDVPF